MYEMAKEGNKRWVLSSSPPVFYHFQTFFTECSIISLANFYFSRQVENEPPFSFPRRWVNARALFLPSGHVMMTASFVLFFQPRRIECNNKIFICHSPLERKFQYFRDKQTVGFILVGSKWELESVGREGKGSYSLILFTWRCFDPSCCGRNGSVMIT